MAQPDDLATAVERAARRRAGLVIGVRHRTGDVEVAGSARGAPAPDGSSLFEIGSVTKTFTALLLADGVVRGDWALTTPVRELLPAGTRVPSRDGAEITLEQLATHSSGLPRSPRRILLRSTIDVFRGIDPYADLTTAGLLAALETTRLERRPGTPAVNYSNFGAGLLGAAMSHATGTAFGPLVQTRICEPLGLRDTTTDDLLTNAQRERLVIGHHRGAREADPWPLAGIAGAGALRSTADDLLRYLEAQLHPDDSPLADAIRLTQQPRPLRRGPIGLGWMRNDKPDPLWWHNGGTGGYRSFVGFIPEKQVAVVVLSNQARMVDLLGMRRLRVAAEA